jgi:predicted RecA/RadA family phage recombinase
MQNMLESRGEAPVTDEVSMPMSDEAGGHGEAGFFASLPTVARDTDRLAPLPLATFAAAWLVLDTLYRRRVLKGKAQGAPSRLQEGQVVAVGGLVASAVLYTGLAPSHFAEATYQGIFFLAASVAAAITAAAILAWPSRLAYITGAGISLGLIVLWALFRIVPAPGAEAVEEVDLVGLVTKATELVAATACIVLWLRTRRDGQIRTEGEG